MGGFIYFKDHQVIFNNRQFSGTITFVSEVARRMATESEMSYVKRMEDNVENYWPGMCFDIETDFPEIEEKNFGLECFMRQLEKFSKEK